MFQARIAALFLLICSVTPAVTLQQLSMDEMTEKATAIVRARVTSASASLTGSTIYTHYKLQISESWKGFTPGEVSIPGGSVKGQSQTFPGVPELTPGAEYVLFLWTSSTGMTHLLGMHQGLFNLTGANDSTLLATRPPIGEMMLDRTGRRVADSQVQMSLADLRSRVSRSTAAPAGTLR